MLKELHLLNFRCFQDHTVPLRPLTIVVGRNNVGKSTLIEALRLVSIVVNRYRNLNYSEAPEWTGLSRRFKGVRPSLRRFEFNQKGAFYQYADPPAEIDATFGSGEQVRVFVGPDAEIFAIIRTVNGTLVNSRSHANRAALPAVHILPQVGPLSLEETVLERDYVRSAVSSPLASSHFRNQLKVLSEHFNEFKRFSEETWHGLEIRELDYGRGYPGDPISLAVRSEAFVGEVGWMGHGLQMWLQTM